jgi:transposase
LKILASQCNLYRRLEVIPGIGIITGTALIASIGNASCFANGRQLASWLGLVLRQNSSGGKVTLLGISKRGDVYLRSLLVQGARAVLNAKLRYASKNNQNYKDHSKFTMWIHNLSQRCGSNKTVVAVVNKLARVVFTVLSSGNDYLEGCVAT